MYQLVFRLIANSYEIVDAEREFKIEIDGHELVGFIDTVYRTPASELLVSDYKATSDTATSTTRSNS